MNKNIFAYKYSPYHGCIKDMREGLKVNLKDKRVI